MNWIHYTSSCIFVILCIADHIFHGGGLPSANGQVVRPPNFSPDAIPETSFTCEDKITGGYYADLEADCQLFHVCVQVSEYEFQDFRFLCPNDTVFDQQNLVCTNWFEVDCTQSVQLFAQDFGFRAEEEEEPRHKDRGSGRGNIGSYEDDYINYEYDYYYEDENDLNNNQNSGQNRFLANRPPATEANRGNPGVGGGHGKSNGFTGFPGNNDQDNLNLNSLFPSNVGTGFQGNNNNLDGGNTGFPRGKLPPSIHSTTAIPLGVTRTTSTTKRPRPHVKSDQRLANNFRNQNKGVKNRLPFLPPTDGPPPSPELFQNIINDDRSADPFRNPPVFSADGRKPRVKSNLRKNKFKTFRNKGNSGGGKKHGNRVSEVNTENIRFVDPGINDLKENVRNNAIGNNGNSFPSGPEVRPDGRSPRVKSNLRARKKEKKKKNGRPVVTTENPFSKFFSPSSTRRPISPSTSPPSVPDFFQNLFTSTPRSPSSNSISPVVSNINLEVEEDDYYDGSGGFISSTRPPFVSSTRRPFVSSTRPPQRPSFTSDRPTNRFTPKRPKVKSDLLAGKRNRDRNRNRFRGNRNKPRDKVRFSNENPRTSLDRQRPNQFFIPTTDRSNVNIRPQVPVKTSIPEDIPEYVDEIDEFRAPTTTTTQRPTRRRPRPKVKSNILAGRRNKPKKSKNRKRVKPNRNKKVKFTSNNINSIEDDTCDNPFKCPPTKTAARPDGRRPRVKSDIKARRRNYHVPAIRKTNRIQGRAKPKQSRFRNNGNQFRNKLKTRRGKSQRQKAFTKTPVATSPSPIENEFIQDDVKSNKRFFPTSTESVLSLFLNQIEIENEDNFRDQQQSNPPDFARPLAPPPRPSTRPFVSQIPFDDESFDDNAFLPNLPSSNSNSNRNQHSFPSFPTIQTETVEEPFEEGPQTRFPPRNRPSPVTHSAPPLPTVPSLRGISSSAVFPRGPSSFSADTSFSTSQNNFNLPISTPTQQAFFPTISQPLSVFVNNNNDNDDNPITSDYVFEYDEEIISEPEATTTTTERTTTRKIPKVKSTRFSFSNFDLDEQERRRPRVKSNILQAIRHKGRNKKFKEGFKTNLKFINNHRNKGFLSDHEEDREISGNNEQNIVERSTLASVLPTQQDNSGNSRKINVIFSTDSDFDSKPSVRPDGRKPRVKSNIKAKHSKKGKSLTKHRVDIDAVSDSGSQNIRVGKSIISFDETVNILDYDTEPEVRPDGLKPNVKSNLLAAAKLKSTRHKTKEGLQGQHSFKHSKKVITTHRPKFLQALLFDNNRRNNNRNNSNISNKTSSEEEQTERALQFHKTTTPPSTTTTKGSISTSTTPTVITTTSKGNTQSPFGSTVPSILGAFLNTLNTRAIDPTLSSQLQDVNGRKNSNTFLRHSSPLPLLFTTLNDRRSTTNSNNKNEENLILNNIKDNINVNEQVLDTKTLNSDSEISVNEDKSNNVYDYYEDYYEAAYENEDRKLNIKKRSYRTPLANAAIAAAASAQV